MKVMYTEIQMSDEQCEKLDEWEKKTGESAESLVMKLLFQFIDNGTDTIQSLFEEIIAEWEKAEMALWQEFHSYNADNELEAIIERKNEFSNRLDDLLRKD